MFRKAIGALIVAFGISTPAVAAWVEVANSSTGSVWYMDPDRIEKKGNRVHAWVKIDYSQDKTVKYRMEMRLYSVICTDKKVKMLAYTEYDSYGKVLGSNSTSDDYGEYNYKPVTPESMGEAMADIACIFNS